MGACARVHAQLCLTLWTVNPCLLNLWHRQADSLPLSHLGSSSIYGAKGKLCREKGGSLKYTWTANSGDLMGAQKLTFLSHPSCIGLKCPSLSIVVQSLSYVCSLGPHGLHHTRFPCLSPSPRAWSNSCPLSRWYHPIILTSVIPFSSCLQSFPELGSFLMSCLFVSGGQSLRASASASVLPMNIRGWFPFGLISFISL